MANFHLEIITPEKLFFDGECESLIIDTAEGKRGILAHHTPMVAAIAEGMLTFKTGGEWKTCYTSGGFAEIRPDGTLINMQIVEWPEEMERRKAEEAQEKSDEHRRQEQSLREFNEVKANIAQAMVQLRVKHSINDE